MNITPIGGKSPSETLLGVAVNASGAVITERAWKTTVTKIAEDVEPTAGTHACTAVDLSTAGAVSLRVSNATNVPIELGLYSDVVNNSYVLRDSSWNTSKLTIPADRTNIVITPDDWPILQWLAKLRLFYKTTDDATAADKAVTIYAVTKG